MKDKVQFLITCLLSLGAVVFLGGCSHMVLLNPKGPIGDTERFVIIAAIALMLIVVVPVFIMTFLFARRYRASNTKATYDPKWSYSAWIDLIVWLVPVAIVTTLAIMAWKETHNVNPYKSLSTSDESPVRIEVVALDWKWLFIYPDLHIASINQLVFPAGVPLSFKITSDTVMTSFFIPQLGSQMYAMAGMKTRLHLMADEPGIYDGHNNQFSGRGFSDMHFKAIATTRKDFKIWVQKARQSPDQLDLSRFEDLRRPSPGYPVTTFSSTKSDLFDYIISRYRPGRDGVLHYRDGKTVHGKAMGSASEGG